MAHAVTSLSLWHQINTYQHTSSRRGAICNLPQGVSFPASWASISSAFKNGCSHFSLWSGWISYPAEKKNQRMIYLTWGHTEQLSGQLKAFLFAFEMPAMHSSQVRSGTCSLMNSLSTSLHIFNECVVALLFIYPLVNCCCYQKVCLYCCYYLRWGTVDSGDPIKACPKMESTCSPLVCVITLSFIPPLSACLYMTGLLISIQWPQIINSVCCCSWVTASTNRPVKAGFSRLSKVLSMAFLWSHKMEDLITFYETISGTQEINLMNNNFYVGIFGGYCSGGFCSGTLRCLLGDDWQAQLISHRSLAQLWWAWI